MPAAHATLCTARALEALTVATAGEAVHRLAKQLNKEERRALGASLEAAVDEFAMRWPGHERSIAILRERVHDARATGGALRMNYGARQKVVPLSALHRFFAALRDAFSSDDDDDPEHPHMVRLQTLSADLTAAASSLPACPAGGADLLARHRGRLPMLSSLHRLAPKASLIKASLIDNACSRVGCPLYGKFAAAVECETAKHAGRSGYAGPKIVIAVHGTPPENVISIARDGFDPSKRSRQVLGPGEYLTTNAEYALRFTSWEPYGRLPHKTLRLLVCAVLVDDARNGREGWGVDPREGEEDPETSDETSIQAVTTIYNDLQTLRRFGGICCSL